MWTEVSLDQLGHLSRGRSRHRPRNDPVLYGGAYPFVQTGDVKAAKLRITEHSQTYGEIGLEQSRLWPENTLCITIAANIGDTALLSYPACFPDSIIGFVADERKCDVRFVKYCFDMIQERLRMVSQGATQDNLSQDKLLRFGIPCPPVETQRAIGDVLSSYDDLIQTNRSRIVLLEESARLLYREWFVNLRFRGYQLVPLVDGLPEKWRVTTYGDIVDAIGGATPSTKRLDYWNGDVVWLTPTDVTRNDCLYLSDSARRITETGYESCSTKLLPPGTIFMTSRASIGYFALLDQPACTNQGFIAVVPKVRNCRNYLLFNLMNRVDEFNAKATGSTFKELSKRTFRDMTVMLPSQEVLDVFEAVTLPIIEQIKVLKKQLIALTLARDELLPRLMSGAIRV
ncbi:MAG TPA: restriction endonuclease subunit S [Accumulibacter sp.]|uniref:restriction endonuclease subunit S n=1 Tax=Accumulibacter sp. TaxID=2053492 RepID=UPI002D10B903|nr:restriction endonuclease subunit S [Accumulibacter sp.]HRF71942.1 restriction endonuclease subunit S [Accumulibacter sp.]